MENKTKLFCFDMDGTLIRNTNSVRYLCKINNQEEKVMEIEKREDANEFSWIDADYLKAELIRGLSVEKVYEDFNKEIELIDNIDIVIKNLRDNGIKSILVTAGPIQVARVLGELYGFDEVFGSDYEVIDNVFTGRILEHLGDAGKLKSLIKYCEKNDISIKNCVAVGDSKSDIDVFRECGRAVAINYSKVLLGKAGLYLKTNDLRDMFKGNTYLEDCFNRGA